MFQFKAPKHFLLLPFFLIAGCGQGLNEPKAPAKTQNQLAVDELFKDWDVAGSAGASVAVIQEGELLYSSAYGEAQVEYGVAIDPTTVFHVASVTKQFTAFGIALLADQDLLSLEDDIRTYIPEVPDFGTKITIRQLANHTSGLRDQWNLLALGGWRVDDVITLGHVMKMVTRQNALNFPPNEEYNYSNTGFTLLAEIVARVGGKPFPIWMEENVFLPLGMDHTLIYDDHEKIVNNRAYSYHTDETGLKKSILSYAITGATSLFTTAEDLTLWMNNFSTHVLGSDEVHNNFRTQGVLNNGETIDYAMGIVASEYRGLKVLGHGGADAGFRSNVIYFPGQKFGVAVLSNLASFNPGGLAEQIADIYLTDQLTPREEPKEETPIETVDVAEDILETYVGLYGFVEMEGLTMEVELEDGALSSVDPNGVIHNFKAIAQNRFTSDKNNTKFEFRENEEGVIDMVIDFGREFMAKRIKKLNLTDTQLKVYVGDYYSTELETSYRIIVRDGALVAVHSRHQDIGLKALEADKFGGTEWFFGETRFERNEEGSITAMFVSSGRVKDLKFIKSQ